MSIALAYLRKYWLPALAAIQAESEKTRERDAAFTGLFTASSMLSAAHTAHLLSLEKAKKNDMDREPEYQERNWKRIREGQERARPPQAWPGMRSRIAT